MALAHAHERSNATHVMLHARCVARVESLALRGVCRGLLNEGEATLRLKMDPANDNRNLGDLIAYRIKFVPHPHVGRKWCVYPSYDFTHCVIDSLENVSHSLCTLEFASRRASYYWLLDKLDLYMPVVWEYSRLNIQHHVMSKRKLQARDRRRLPFVERRDSCRASCSSDEAGRSWGAWPRPRTAHARRSSCMASWFEDGMTRAYQPWQACAAGA